MIPATEQASPFNDERNLLYLLYNNTEEYFLLIDPELRVCMYNRNTFDQVRLHMGIELRRGMPVLELSEPETHDALRELYRDVLNGTVRETDRLIHSRLGETRTLHNHFRPARDQEGRIVAIMMIAHDITEQKKISENLRRNEEMWRFALEGSNLGVWDSDLVNGRMHFSPSYERLYGFAPGSLSNDRAVWRQRVHPDDLPRIRMAVDAHLTGQVPHYECSYRIRDVNDEYRWVQARGRVVAWDADGRPTRMLGTHADITDKVTAEEALRASNERYRLTTRATSDAIYDWDLCSNNLYWGEGMHTLFGYQGADVTIDKWEQFIHPAEHAVVTASLDLVMADPKQEFWKFEYRFRRKDGAWSDVLDRGYILRDPEGKALRMIGAMQDITTQKARERALTESNERFDMVLRATNDLIWDWNLVDNSFYRDADGLRRIYGVNDANGIGLFENWLERVHPEDREALATDIAGLLASIDRDSFESEYRFRRDDGQYVYIYDRGLLLRDGSGRPTRLIGAAQDISERKKMEQQLVARELTRQKLISKATLETQERERAEIGKELHDNVNQVLTTTKLYLDLSMSTPELREDLIQKSSRNIIYVINEIRALSRSLMNPSLGDLGLVAAIQDLVESVNLTGKIEVGFTADAALERDLDEQQQLMVFRILQEALNNALRHSGARHLEIRLREVGGDLQLVVRDDGVGFDPAQVKKGSGLRNVENRVYLANGSLRVESQPQQGCTLVIQLPMKTKHS
ncbi:PAS domain-containing sensor histidine kinase [Flaviaesturariibacter amylovorans]|uniref:histidine kinase n=1 Tax=Flaviaesturariibacter amylovorans TaxID=1084520 RepID=A0ABP8GNV7_9BACT